jgi:hypothetical protein
MGLTYCIGSKFVAGHGQESDEVSLNETLIDMHDSCKMAILTLNDILTYDKLEGGDMKVDRVVIPVRRLILNHMKGFEVQVLEIITPSREGLSNNWALDRLDNWELICSTKMNAISLVICLTNS